MARVLGHFKSSDRELCIMGAPHGALNYSWCLRNTFY